MSEISKLQGLLLNIADEIHGICNKHNISYRIDGGTQLGAIRHHGFIPWDDDFDIAMRRDDYERFLQVCEIELDRKKYFLQNEKTEEFYPFAFSKIQLVGTEIIEDFSKNVPVHHGIFVDIFPYDELPENFLIQKIFLFENLLLKNMLWAKCGYGTDRHKRKASYKLCKFIASPFPLKWLKKRRYVLITKYRYEGNPSCFTSDYPKTILKTKWFDTTVDYPFEDRKYNGFEEYEDFLVSLYGEYMIMPPPEKRKRHTHYDIDYGPY